MKAHPRYRVQSTTLGKGIPGDGTVGGNHEGSTLCGWDSCARNDRVWRQHETRLQLRWKHVVKDVATANHRRFVAIAERLPSRPRPHIASALPARRTSSSGAS